MLSSHSRKHAGFTLVEIMVVVSIVAILAALAFPSYQDSVRKSKRSNGKVALSQVQLLQERRRTNNATYGTWAQIGSPTDPEGNYTITIAGNTATGYVATATAVGDQANDSAQGVSCTPLTITVAAGVTTKAPAACW